MKKVKQGTARQDSFVQHLVCPETEKEETFLRSVKSAIRIDIPTSGIAPWSKQQKIEDSLSEKRAKTSHSRLSSKKTIRHRPATTFQPVRQRQPTPLQKARWEARCLLTGSQDNKVASLLHQFGNK